MENENNRNITETIEVYNTLRNSIIRNEESIVNESIYMYVVYFAMLTLGLSNDILLLTSFIVLIVFQTMINEERLAIERASAYIRVFFENTQEYNIHWETLHKDPRFLTRYGKIYHNVSSLTRKCGATFLAALSLIIMIKNQFPEFAPWESNTFNWSALLKLLFALGLFIVVFWVNVCQYYNSASGDYRVDELMDEIKVFHSKCSVSKPD